MNLRSPRLLWVCFRCGLDVEDRTNRTIWKRVHAGGNQRLSDKSVFYRGDVVTGADRASFVVLPVAGEGVTAQDKHGQFNYEKRVQQ